MWKVIIIAILIAVVIRSLLLPRTYCPHCKKRTGDRYGDKGEDGPTYCSNCLDVKGFETEENEK